MVWATGWTFEDVLEQFDLPRAKAMFNHWKKHPPAGAILKAIATYIGCELKEPPKLDFDNPENPGLLEALAAIAGG